MATNRLRECLVCHRPYEYCPRCDADHGKPLWMISFCSSNCMTIIDTATEYGRGELSIEKAYDIISKCDLSGRNGWTKAVTRDVDNILSYKKDQEQTDTFVDKPITSFDKKKKKYRPKNK